MTSILRRGWQSGIKGFHHGVLHTFIVYSYSRMKCGLRRSTSLHAHCTPARRRWVSTLHSAAGERKLRTLARSPAHTCSPCGWLQAWEGRGWGGRVVGYSSQQPAAYFGQLALTVRSTHTRCVHSWWRCCWVTGSALRYPVVYVLASRLRPCIPHIRAACI